VDEGSEYLNAQLKSALAAKGIELQITAPYSQSQNGVSERMNRTLVELARAMITAKDLPKSLWEFAVTHAAYIRNRSTTKALPGGVTPHQAFTKEKPDVSHFQEFRAPVCIFREDVKQLSKMDDRGLKHIFCGYLDGPKAIRYYDSRTRRVKVSRNFQFTDPAIKFTELADVPSEGEKTGNANGTSVGPTNKPAQTQSTAKNEAPTTPNTPTAKSPPPTTTPMVTTEHNPKPNQLNPIPLRKLTRTVTDHNYLKLGNPGAKRQRANRPDRTASSDNIEDDDNADNDMAHFVFMASIGEIDPGIPEIPRSINEARALPEWPRWEEAINVELEKLTSMETWILKDCPPEQKPVGCRWVFPRNW
jgi:hypothetical protein